MFYVATTLQVIFVEFRRTFTSQHHIYLDLNGSRTFWRANKIIGVSLNPYPNKPLFLRVGYTNPTKTL